MRTLLIVVLALVACRKHEVSPEELKGKLATATPGEEVEVSKGIYMAMYRSQVVSPVRGELARGCWANRITSAGRA